MEIDPDAELDGPLSLSEVLETLDPLADEPPFRVLLALKAAGEGGASAREVAQRLDRNHADVREDIERLTSAGVAEERMECLVEACEVGRERYEVSDFGRTVLEEGLLAAIGEANGFSAPPSD